MDEKEKKDKPVEVAGLAPYVKLVIRQLKEDKKYPAVHTYNSTLNSFTKFWISIGKEMPKRGNSEISENGDGMEKMPMNEVFTPGKLKEYENWLRSRKASWNTVSTYMRTLKAVYNRHISPGSVDYNAHLFDNVYTKVVSQTKRALTREQMNTLLYADFESLPKDVQCTLAYFLLMFMFRGMPFIDLAYLRKQDVKGNKIVYCRHKTGKQITVRIHKEAETLFEKYRSTNPDSVYLFPILDSKLEKEGELYQCYLDALGSFNKKLAKVVALLLPGTKISSYTARHTWATLAFYLGIPVGAICEALGHSSIRVTEAYLKPFSNEKVDSENDKLIDSVMNGREKMKAA